MSKEIPRILLILIFCLLMTGCIFFQWWISRNSFLDTFLNGSYLSVMGTIVSITVASCSNIYLRLGQLEAAGRGPFPGTKKALRKSAFSLVFIFSAAFFILVLRGAIDASGRFGAFLNSLLICGVFFFCSVLLDITRVAFKLPSS